MLNHHSVWRPPFFCPKAHLFSSPFSVWRPPLFEPPFFCLRAPSLPLLYLSPICFLYFPDPLWNPEISLHSSCPAYANYHARCVDTEPLLTFLVILRLYILYKLTLKKKKKNLFWQQTGLKNIAESSRDISNLPILGNYTCCFPYART